MAPSLRAARNAGKFHAVNAATTPTGVGSARRSPPGTRPGMTRPSIRGASSPLNRNVSTARAISPAASAGTFPASADSSAATSMSPSPASATPPAVAPVAGSTFSSRAAPSRHSPATNSRASTDIAGAVDVNGRAGGVAGQAGGEERHDVREVLRLRDLAERRVVGEEVEPVLGDERVV